MWMIPVRCLCNRHLLGEHGEIHKHRWVFERNYSISGRINPVVQIEPLSMEIRHNELAEEMIRRGMNHSSDYILPNLSYLINSEREAKVDINISIHELSGRCPECKKRIENYYGRKNKKALQTG